MNHQLGQEGKITRHVILSTMIEGYAYFCVVADSHGKPTALLFLETNDSLGHLLQSSQ